MPPQTSSTGELHSRCTQVPIRDIGEAVSLFSQKNDRGEIPLVLIPDHRGLMAPYITIPFGCTCLMQKWGEDVGKADPGMAFYPPWYRVAYVVTIQSTTYNAPVKECPTSDNVRVNVDAIVVFTIRDAVKFVYKLGAVHFDQLLSGAVDEGIRLLVRHQNHHDVRSLRGSRAEAMLTILNTKFEQLGVNFTDVKITQVVLPEDLQKSLTNYTEMKKAMEKEVEKQKYDLDNLTRTAEIEIEELGRKCENVKTVENGKKRRAELDRNHQQEKAKEERQKKLIEVSARNKVMLTESTSQLSRVKLEMEQYRVSTLSKAEADADLRYTQADIAYEMALVNAEAEKEKLLGQAKATGMEAEAEAIASTMLIEKRKHELDLREKTALAKLAQMGSYNLIGEPGDRMVDALLTGKVDTTGKSSNWFKK